MLLEVILFLANNNRIPLRSLRLCAEKSLIKKAPAGGAFLYLFKNVASCRNYADSSAFSGTTNFKLDVAIGCCKQGMVATHANIITGVKLGATLTDKDVACKNVFATTYPAIGALIVVDSIVMDMYCESR